MELLGLASIMAEMGAHAERRAGHAMATSPILLGWESPDTMVLRTVGGDVSVEDVAASVHEYLGLLAGEADVISRSVPVGGKSHSPLSPRVAPVMTREELESYQDVRTDILDEVGGENRLFERLVSSLGFPAYWTERNDGSKGTPDLYQGASRWEMAPRNQGSEFMRQKYLENMRACAGLSEDDIAARIRGEKAESLGKERNACGLHAPAHLDVLMTWIALNGISQLPTRPVTDGAVGSISTGAIVAKVGGRRRVFFVLPVTSNPVTLERYAAICRSSAICRLASHALSVAPRMGHISSDPELEHARSWLRAHGVGRVAVFERHVGGTSSCPEYYALDGSLVAVEGGRP